MTKGKTADDADRERASMAERRLKALMEKSTDLILVLDIRGTIIMASDSSRDILGTDPGDLLGQNVSLIVHQDDLASIVEHGKRFQETEHPIGKVMVTMLRSGGGVRRLEFSGASHRAGGALLEFLLIGRDVSAEESTRKELDFQVAFERLCAEGSASLIHLPPEEIGEGIKTLLERTGRFLGARRGFAWFIEKGDDRIREVLEWNAVEANSFKDRILSYSLRSDFPGFFSMLKAGETILVPDASLLPQNLGSEREELVLKGAAAALRVPIVAEGELTGVLGYDFRTTGEKIGKPSVPLLKLLAQAILNAYRQRETLTALSKSEGRYRLLFERSPALHVVVDPEMRIMDMNDSFLRLVGYERGELMGRHISCLLEEGQREALAQRMKLVLGGLELGTIEWRVVAKDGSRRTAMGRSGKRERLEYPDGRTGYFFELMDVTELREAERRERQEREELYQASKLASLGTLLAGVTHEINNPNNFIRMSVDNLKDFWTDIRGLLDARDPDRGEILLGGIPYPRARDMIEKMLASVREGSERIEKLVLNLKDFVRKGESGKREPASIDRIVTGAVEIAGHLIARSTGRFSVRLPQSEAWAMCDRGQIEQVVMNLLTNACQALTSQDQSVRVEVIAEKDKPWIGISVSDGGRGMSVEELQRATDPFYTTKRSTGGTGLGLAISQRIATDHGGTLELVSEPGKGTVATLKLPLYDLKERPAAREIEHG